MTLNRFNFKAVNKLTNEIFNKAYLEDEKVYCKVDNDWITLNREFTKILQSTGLKDKNKKEIFEDDKLKDVSGNIWQVKWSKDYATFYMKPINNKGRTILYFYELDYPTNEMEII